MGIAQPLQIGSAASFKIIQSPVPHRGRVARQEAFATLADIGDQEGERCWPRSPGVSSYMLIT